MQNVAFGKLGRSMKFKRKNWRDVAGNNEPATLLSLLANMHPENTYYIIGRSDFSRCSKEQLDYWFKYDNVIDVWEDFDDKIHDKSRYAYEVTKDIHFDYGIINGGITGRVNIPNVFYTLDNKTGKTTQTKVKTLEMLQRYSAPIIDFLNRSNIKWINFHADGRQFPINARDMINEPIITLGMKNKTDTIRRFTSYDDQTQLFLKEDMIYAASELLCLLDKEYYGQPLKREEKEYKVGLFFHEYKNDEIRSEEIDSYVNIFNDDEIVVFGKWQEKIKEGNKKYKGSLKFDEMQKTLPKIKYTLCYPVIEGDISAKWAESIRAGIIPFFDKKYDAERLLNKTWNVPEFLYVDGPDDMKKKIEYIENNEDYYNQLLIFFDKLLTYFYKNLPNIYDSTFKKYLKGE